MKDATMATLVRLAIESDIEAIFDIRTGVRENYLSRQQLEQRGITPEAIREMLAAAPCTWIAEVDGIPAGFSMADAEEGSVFAAFVRPEFEGQGLGRALLAQAEAFLFRQHRTLWLETAASSRAYGFYSRQGWQPVADMPNGDVRFEKHRD